MAKAGRSGKLDPRSPINPLVRTLNVGCPTISLSSYRYFLSDVLQLHERITTALKQRLVQWC
ncbi:MULTISPECIES: hypothetical protein [Methanococcoides]|uniref:Uncharacterized protein n=1 Tax=Methanococcoides seepicolus TaxID=2828780 RepID=A0A9E5DBZ9_9EURY|nr:MULTISPECIES: hypothetical protein [Methanococcoides]MCM1987372.1 hypothetical protein [Methanococcoides seepicolus]